MLRQRLLIVSPLEDLVSSIKCGILSSSKPLDENEMVSRLQSTAVLGQMVSDSEHLYACNLMQVSQCDICATDYLRAPSLFGRHLSTQLLQKESKQQDTAVVLIFETRAKGVECCGDR